MERECYSVDPAPPHQTGATEPSISDGNGDAGQHVIDHVMVSNAVNRIRARGLFQIYGNELFVRVQFRFGDALKGRAARRMEQKFKNVELCETSQQKDGGGSDDTAPGPRGRVEQQSRIERQRQVSLIPGAQCLPHEVLVDGCLGDVGGAESTLEPPFVALRLMGTGDDERSTTRQVGTNR